MAHESELNFKATELRLGLPGTDDDSDTKNSNINNKRALPEDQNESKCVLSATKPGTENRTSAPAPKAQIVGWPPVRSYRKSIIIETKKTENEIYYVKVSMDGAPYLRKIDLKLYNGYQQLLKALETMFKFTLGEYSEREGYKGSDFAPAYEDKDGDLMLLGDVPWNMFMSSCKRLRIMKGSEAKGLGCGV